MKFSLFRKSGKNVSASTPSSVGVDAETFLPDFLNKLNFTFASFARERFLNNFKAQTKGRRERKRKGKEEEGKGRGRETKRKGKGEREIGSEALAETEKIANAPAGNRTRDPSKRG